MTAFEIAWRGAAVALLLLVTFFHSFGVLVSDAGIWLVAIRLLVSVAGCGAGAALAAFYRRPR